MRIEEAWAKLHRAADLASGRGSLLFHLDLATVLARAAFALRGIAFDQLATLVDEQGYRVLALDAAPSRRALAEARFDDRGEVQIVAADSQPPRASVLADARATLAAARFEGAETHAILVVPADDPRAAIEGYAIAVGEDPAIVKPESHWHVTLDPDGRRIVRRAPLLVTERDAPAAIQALRDATLTVADAVPGEIHTYLSLKHGVPLTVRTRESGALWRVDGEHTNLAK